MSNISWRLSKNYSFISLRFILSLASINVEKEGSMRLLYSILLFIRIIIFNLILILLFSMIILHPIRLLLMSLLIRCHLNKRLLNKYNINPNSWTKLSILISKPFSLKPIVIKNNNNNSNNNRSNKLNQIYRVLRKIKRWLISGLWMKII